MTNLLHHADTRPVLSDVRKHSGVAGAYEYSVDVTYPGEETHRLSFVHNVYGGPVVMVTPGGQHFVSADVMDRCGQAVTEAWLLLFFGLDPATDSIGTTPRPEPRSVCGAPLSDLGGVEYEDDYCTHPASKIDGPRGHVDAPCGAVLVHNEDGSTTCPDAPAHVG